VKFVADECCDAILVAGIRADGHDVLYVMEFAPGLDDETILAHAAADERIVLTEDKDFGELAVQPRTVLFHNAAEPLKLHGAVEDGQPQ
jgi:predicted nuclease of predicted toxin-antitoxin system